MEHTSERRQISQKGGRMRRLHRKAVDALYRNLKKSCKSPRTSLSKNFPLIQAPGVTNEVLVYQGTWGEKD